MSGRVGRLKAQIERWADAGLIDGPTAQNLIRDVETNTGRGLSFGQVFAMMAAALFGASILIFIAANWDAIPRLTRVGMIFTVIGGSWLAGSVLVARGNRVFGEVLWLVAATAFGGGIALIGQMYHLSGDEREAILVWFGATALASVLLRSGPLTVGAGILSLVWLAMGVGWSRTEAFPHFWMIFALAVWGISFWTDSRASRHLLLLGALGYLVAFYAHTEALWLALAMAGIGAGLIAAVRWAPERTERLSGMGAGLYVHGFFYFAAGMIILHLFLEGDRAFLFAPLLTFAGIAAAIILAGGRSTALRRLAYAAFAVELCYVYVVMLGTMVDTAGFFLFVGLVLAGLAVLVTRMERRFGRAAAPEAAS